ncbi:MAG: P1 family peptidase [Woeseiaceae bacterium]|nr:P1 family peptidase [Woeseiaceae bacterium]
MRASIALAFLSAALAGAVHADGPRARDLGIPFEGNPGPLNAITDVAGVQVGHRTLVRDLEDGKAIRTGVTAILPRGAATNTTPVFAGWFRLNGNGEMTGTTWVEESGFLEGPVMITNTHSVGAVHEGTIRWRLQQGAADATGYWWSLPVVAETYDGFLNDINGLHVRPEHAAEALQAASGGPVEEGAVGGGTGMICHEFKCGIGTSSRIAETEDGDFTIGVLVQANYGLRDQLRVAGVPVGRYLDEHRLRASHGTPREHGSIIIVVATDAPLLPHQLDRLARRAAMGLARVGSTAGNGSGDIFIAFSTANADVDQAGEDMRAAVLANEILSPIFTATVMATEEAIVNALVAGRDMRGHRGNFVAGIDHDALRQALARHNVLAP